MIEDILASHAGREGPLLPILHDLQAAQGFVSEDDIRVIAHTLNLSRAEVSGVVSFYHDFRRAPVDRPVLKLCRAEACQARGVEGIAPIAEADARVKVETIYCLGLCSVGPSAMAGDEVYARLDEASLRGLLDKVALA